MKFSLRTLSEPCALSNSDDLHKTDGATSSQLSCSWSFGPWMCRRTTATSSLFPLTIWQHTGRRRWRTSACMKPMKYGSEHTYSSAIGDTFERNIDSVGRWVTSVQACKKKKTCKDSKTTFLCCPRLLRCSCGRKSKRNRREFQKANSILLTAGHGSGHVESAVILAQAPSKLLFSRPFVAHCPASSGQSWSLMGLFNCSPTEGTFKRRLTPAD